MDVPTVSTTGVAATLLLALMIDYASVGPNSVRDRAAFLLALPMLRIGFDGSSLDRWTVARLEGWIRAGLDAPGDPETAQASTSAVLSVLIAILAIVTVGALLPDRVSSRLGRFTQITFSPKSVTITESGRKTTKYRLNWRLWTCALLLGMLADLPQGAVGTILRACVDSLTIVVAQVPQALFGVS